MPMGGLRFSRVDLRVALAILAFATPARAQRQPQPAQSPLGMSARYNRVDIL
jgi:hypothetical protein